MSELEKYYSEQTVICAYLGFYEAAKRNAIRARIAFAIEICRNSGRTKDDTWAFVAEYIKYA